MRIGDHSSSSYGVPHSHPQWNHGDRASLNAIINAFFYRRETRTDKISELFHSNIDEINRYLLHKLPPKTQQEFKEWAIHVNKLCKDLQNPKEEEYATPRLYKLVDDLYKIFDPFI